ATKHGDSSAGFVRDLRMALRQSGGKPGSGDPPRYLNDAQRLTLFAIAGLPSPPGRKRACDRTEPHTGCSRRNGPDRLTRYLRTRLAWSGGASLCQLRGARVRCHTRVNSRSRVTSNEIPFDAPRPLLKAAVDLAAREADALHLPKASITTEQVLARL